MHTFVDENLISLVIPPLTFLDCIYLDYEMPVMNGPEAAKEIRAIGCESCMVGVTGNVLSEDVSYFIECGVSSVFPKPVKIESLETFWDNAGLLR